MEILLFRLSKRVQDNQRLWVGIEYLWVLSEWTGGATDRVMGFDLGLKYLPRSHEKIFPQMEQLCKYCGHFCSRHFIPKEQRETIVGSPMSKSWNTLMRISKGRNLN